MCVCLLVCMSTTYTHRNLCRPIEGIRFPGTGITDVCELPNWILGSKPRSSTGTASVLNHRAISSAPDIVL